jgi:hypothetical protein
MRSKLKGFIYLLFFSWLGLLHTQHGETSVMLWCNWYVYFLYLSRGHSGRNHDFNSLCVELCILLCTVCTGVQLNYPPPSYYLVYRFF